MIPSIEIETETETILQRCSKFLMFQKSNLKFSARPAKARARLTRLKILFCLAAGAKTLSNCPRCGR